jgi:peptidoglycan hydrolase-like protein with peptidoglycan-binding domain
MRYLFGKSRLIGLILAALAAGACSVPAVGAPRATQSATSSSGNKKAATRSAAHHSASSGASSSRTASSSASVKKTTTASTAPKPATSDSGAKKTGVKSTHAKASSRRKTKKVKGQEAPTSDRINEIQEALAAKGAFAGTPTGKWDDDTAAAMKRFQTSQGLNPSGKLDALTLQKLGLGSQTAGLAKPTPPPNAVNRLRNTTSAPEPTTDTDEPRN